MHRPSDLSGRSGRATESENIGSRITSENVLEVVGGMCEYSYTCEWCATRHKPDFVRIAPFLSCCRRGQLRGRNGKVKTLSVEAIMDELTRFESECRIERDMAHIETQCF